MPAGFPIAKANIGATATLFVGHPARIIGGTVFNTSASQGYVVFFDAAQAGDVVVGTTTPVYWVPVSPSDNESVCGGGEEIMFEKGIVVACVDAPIGSNIARTCHVTIVVT
jgi:hypothetical protein